MDTSESPTLPHFGELLTTLRERAGFKTQSEAVRAMSRLSSGSDRPLSKSMLSLFERGEVKTIKPETLKIIAAVYKTSYEKLAQRWFIERYGVDPTVSGVDSFVKRADREVCVLQGPEGTDLEEMPIISVSKLTERQSELPDGAQVGVAALSFLDDNVVFFDMVARNLSRGITYYYLMPEDEHVTYKTFLTRVIERYPELEGKLDGKLTHFIPRVPLDHVANYVVYVFPDGELAGYVGLLAVARPHYFQVAGLHLTWRLFESFRWATTVAEDVSIKKGLSDLHLRVGKMEFKASGKRLSPLV